MFGRDTSRATFWRGNNACLSRVGSHHSAAAAAGGGGTWTEIAPCWHGERRDPEELRAAEYLITLDYFCAPGSRDRKRACARGRELTEYKGFFFSPPLHFSLPPSRPRSPARARQPGTPPNPSGHRGWHTAGHRQLSARSCSRLSRRRVRCLPRRPHRRSCEIKRRINNEYKSFKNLYFWGSFGSCRALERLQVEPTCPRRSVGGSGVFRRGCAQT